VGDPQNSQYIIFKQVNTFVGLDNVEGSDHGFNIFHNIPHSGLLDDLGKCGTT
jgi:hypothetical protein